MRRIILSLVMLGIMLYAHSQPMGAFEYSVWMFTLLTVTVYSYGVLFAFFLLTGLLALVNAEMGGEGFFKSVFLPFYTGFSIIGLLMLLVWMYPKLLGQQVKSSQHRGLWFGGWGG